MSWDSGGSVTLYYLATCLLCGTVVNTGLPENKPAIVNDIQNLTKSLNGIADLNCTVRNKGTLKVYWQQEFNGKLILISSDANIVASNPVGGEYPSNRTKYDLTVTTNSDVTYSLRIERLGELDVGVYVCSLVQLGSTQPIISKQGSITIPGIDSDAPKFVYEIGTVNGRINGSATLPCRVANKGNYAVKWRRMRDNSDITSDTRVLVQNPIVDGETKFSIMERPFNSGQQFELTVNRLTEEDGGAYKCLVSTSQENGELFVRVPPDISSPTPENITISVGGSTDLTCRATGNPTPPVIWRRADYQNLPNGGQQYKGETVRITNAKPEQRGVYKCQAANGVFPDNERIFRVHVRFDPIARAQESNATQAVGYPVTMSCIMEGYPAYSSSWNKVVDGNRIPISSSTDYVITEIGFDGESGMLDTSEFHLRIERLKASDYGEYECVASSESGASSRAVIKLIKSEHCVGSVCPVTNNPSATDPTSRSTTCKGDNCTGGSSRLQSPVIFIMLTIFTSLFRV